MVKTPFLEKYTDNLSAKIAKKKQIMRFTDEMRKSRTSLLLFAGALKITQFWLEKRALGRLLL